ncbi:hypothetical protein EZS27_013103 [termite gut metagenome]|uniref:Uncharacterized protein n=1 Tax=termite gut metagenome TaxID=433724 RepID=A0A5J4S0J7_9ZZZZ
MKQLSIFNSPLSTIRACPHGSGYPLQFFLLVPSQKEFPLLSFTHHADCATNSRLLCLSSLIKDVRNSVYQLHNENIDKQGIILEKQSRYDKICSF